MRSMKPDPAVRVRKLRIQTPHGNIPALILSPKQTPVNATGVLWLHGGGYIAGMKEMVHMSRAVDLVKRFGAVVLSPGYRLALRSPYPAALDDCYASLLYLKANAASLGVRADQLMVGGESAGGGLAAALCMLARDRGDVNIAFQMPLYPMIDHRDTDSSRNNHGISWNTRRNHAAWKSYLRNIDGAIPAYASPARQTDYRNLPPAYTFVGDREPFCCETIAYIENLQKANVPARVDVYPSGFHAFDMLLPFRKISKAAIREFEKQYLYAAENYRAAQDD